jgi:hypothetical protein
MKRFFLLFTVNGQHEIGILKDKKQFLSALEALFAELLPVLGKELNCDRVFLHLREPHTRFYKNICWRRSQSMPNNRARHERANTNSNFLRYSQISHSAKLLNY